MMDNVDKIFMKPLQALATVKTYYCLHLGNFLLSSSLSIPHEIILESRRSKISAALCVNRCQECSPHFPSRLSTCEKSEGKWRKSFAELKRTVCNSSKAVIMTDSFARKLCDERKCLWLQATTKRVFTDWLYDQSIWSHYPNWQCDLNVPL